MIDDAHARIPCGAQSSFSDGFLLQDVGKAIGMVIDPAQLGFELAAKFPDHDGIALHSVRSVTLMHRIPQARPANLRMRRMELIALVPGFARKITT
jgi:hypothetical protein